MREAFISKNFKPASVKLIKIANSILAEYAAQGYDLSLRQLYYQFVARGYLPNSQQSYSNLGSIISDARLAGLIDWNMIRDRGRTTVRNTHWNSPSEILRASANQFKIDKWEDQPSYVEVMVEKQALEGVLVPVCRQVDVPFTANKGYSSSSAMYEASKRMLERLEDGREVHVVYLGDHDPSGIDMTRDIIDRLEVFLGEPAGPEPDENEDSFDDWWYQQEQWEEVRGPLFQVHRIALNMDQVLTYNPPQNPAKMTDSRAQGYIAEYGTSSWELDALEPTVMADLVRNIVEDLRDEDLWEEALERENAMKQALKVYADQWDQEHAS